MEKASNRRNWRYIFTLILVGFVLGTLRNEILEFLLKRNSEALVALMNEALAGIWAGYTGFLTFFAPIILIVLVKQLGTYIRDSFRGHMTVFALLLYGTVPLALLFYILATIWFPENIEGDMSQWWYVLYWKYLATPLAYLLAKIFLGTFLAVYLLINITVASNVQSLDAYLVDTESKRVLAIPVVIGIVNALFVWSAVSFLNI